MKRGAKNQVKGDLQGPTRKMESSLLIQAVTGLIRPAVRFAMRHGLKVQDLIEICKRELLRAAESNLANSKKKTLSHLCIQTGLHRNDVKRLMSDESEELVKDDYTTKIVGQWQGDPVFQTKKGKPKDLSFGSSESEFNQLCQKVTKDFNPSSLLKELIRLDVVEVVDDTVRLKDAEVFYDDDVARGFELLSHDSHDMTAAVESNLLHDVPFPHLHRRTEYDHIDSEDLPQISSWIYEQGVSFHKKLRSYLSNFDADLNPDTLPLKGKRSRIVIGSFSFTEIHKGVPHDEEM